MGFDPLIYRIKGVPYGPNAGKVKFSRVKPIIKYSRGREI